VRQVRAGVRDVRKADKIFRGEDAPAGVGYTGEKDAPPPIECSCLFASCPTRSSRYARS
jgi:hypothetical protein